MAVNIRDVNINDVGFGRLRVEKTGGRCIPVTYSDGQPLRINAGLDMLCSRECDPHFAKYVEMTPYDWAAYAQQQKGTCGTFDGIERSTYLIRLDGCDTYGREKSHLVDKMSLLYNFVLDLEERVMNMLRERRDLPRNEFKSHLGIGREKKDGDWIPSGKTSPHMRFRIDWKLLKDNFNRRVKYTLSPHVYIMGNRAGVTWIAIPTFESE